MNYDLFKEFMNLIHLEKFNNYLTLDKFANDFKLSQKQAQMILEIAERVHRIKHEL